MDATGVCSGCAGCESDVEALIEGFRQATEHVPTGQETAPKA